MFYKESQHATAQNEKSAFIGYNPKFQNSKSKNEGQHFDGNITSSLPHNSSYYFAGYYQHENPLWADSWLFVYEQGATTAPTGFVKAKYITWLPSYGYSSDCFTTTVEVTPGQFVHLREKPSTTATSIGHLHNGDIVLVLKAYDSPVNGWTHIATSQGTGWIKTNFLHTQG